MVQRKGRPRGLRHAVDHLLGAHVEQLEAGQLPPPGHPLGLAEEVGLAAGVVGEPPPDLVGSPGGCGAGHRVSVANMCSIRDAPRVPADVPPGRTGGWEIRTRICLRLRMPARSAGSIMRMKESPPRRHVSSSRHPSRGGSDDHHQTDRRPLRDRHRGPRRPGGRSRRRNRRARHDPGTRPVGALPGRAGLRRRRGRRHLQRRSGPRPRADHTGGRPRDTGARLVRRSGARDRRGDRLPGRSPERLRHARPGGSRLHAGRLADRLIRPDDRRRGRPGPRGRRHPGRRLAAHGRRCRPGRRDGWTPS